ncbi:hypothetical protein ZWY2020_056661 [Hordeum vulgare]|nr:hypothetical protein ZWY2020_056661 [Hordeum vulgare]
MHAPWYDSYNYHYMEGDSMRVMYEPWFVKYKVDLVFAGHVHAYERMSTVSSTALGEQMLICNKQPSEAQETCSGGGREDGSPWLDGRREVAVFELKEGGRLHLATVGAVLEREEGGHLHIDVGDGVHVEELSPIACRFPALHKIGHGRLEFVWKKMLARVDPLQLSVSWATLVESSQLTHSGFSDRAP